MATNPANGEVKTAEKKKSRVNVANKLGLNMSLPRVRTRIRETVNGPEENKKVMQQLKERLEAVKKGKAPAGEESELKLERLIRAEEEKYYRLKSDAPMAMTALLDYVIRESLVATFDHCKGLKKEAKTVYPHHVYDALATKPVLTALFSLSGSFEAKLYHNIKDIPKKEDKQKLSPDEKKKISKQGFKTYIGHIIQSVKKSNEKYSTVRITDPMKEAFDKITQEVTLALSQIASNLCDIDDVRTITEKHIIKAFESVMLARRVKRDQFETLVKFMYIKLNEYEKYKETTATEKETTRKAGLDKDKLKEEAADEAKESAKKHKAEREKLEKAVTRAQTNLTKAEKSSKWVASSKADLEEARVNLKKFEATTNGVKG